MSLNLNVPAYTIEVGNANLPHPIGEDQLLLIFEQNKDVPLTVLNEINKLTPKQNQSRPRTLFQKMMCRFNRI